jgi:hypothetical protein
VNPVSDVLVISDEWVTHPGCRVNPGSNVLVISEEGVTHPETRVNPVSDELARSDKSASIAAKNKLAAEALMAKFGSDSVGEESNSSKGKGAHEREDKDMRRDES